MLLSIVLAILLCLGGYWWYHYARIPNKFPNGPYGLPFIGYIGILKAPNLIEAFKGLIFIFASSTCARTSWNQTRNRNPYLGCPIPRLRISLELHVRHRIRSGLDAKTSRLEIQKRGTRSLCNESVRKNQINLFFVFFTPCSCFMKLTGNVLASILDRTSVAW